MGDEVNSRATDAASTKTSGVGSWLFVVAFIWILSFLRFFADGMTCGDDGAADYGSSAALDFCRFLSRRDAHDLFDAGAETRGYVHLAAMPLGLISSAVALSSAARRPHTSTAAALVAVSVFAVPALAEGVWFFLLYALPFVAAVVIAMRNREPGGSVARSLIVGCTLAACLWIPTIYFGNA